MKPQSPHPLPLIKIPVVKDIVTGTGFQDGFDTTGDEDGRNERSLPGGGERSSWRRNSYVSPSSQGIKT